MKTQQDLINEACKNKGILLKTMCSDLNINYKSYRSAVRQSKFSYKRALKICDYLNIDLHELMAAPLTTDVKYNKVNKDED